LAAYEPASSFMKAANSTGLTMWPLNPASQERRPTCESRQE
jgi:hypothetical protein